MGLNQSLSCHAASSCAVIPSSSLSSWTASYTGSIKDGSVVAPCAVAKVILLDGRILHFTGTVTSSQVLASFHHHCICPLDSVSQVPSRSSHAKGAPPSNDSAPAGTITTFFRPVCLQPNDLLLPSCVYILLPRRTFRMFATAAAAAVRNRRVMEEEGPRGCKATKASRVWDSACESKEGNQARQSAVYKHDTCSGSSFDSKTTKPVPCGRLTSPRRCAPLPSSTTEGSQDRHISSAPYRSLSVDRHRTSPSQCRSRRCPPPSMRRCKSWRPGLEAINEAQAIS